MEQLVNCYSWLNQQLNTKPQMNKFVFVMKQANCHPTTVNSNDANMHCRPMFVYVFRGSFHDVGNSRPMPTLQLMDITS